MKIKLLEPIEAFNAVAGDVIDVQAYLAEIWVGHNLAEKVEEKAKAKTEVEVKPDEAPAKKRRVKKATDEVETAEDPETPEER